jgi:NADPH:quinone reductase
MRAAYIARFGDPDGLEVRDVPEPAVPPRHVLVRVTAAALNRADLLQRMGKYPPPAGIPKEIPGIEFAGAVVRPGPESARWREGDRVFAITGGAAQAEYVSVHEDVLAAVPPNLNDADAAAIPEAFITAHDALLTQAGLKAGERVLIHAVASGVGLAAVQICRAWGAIPYGTTRSESKIAAVRALGLEQGLAVVNDVTTELESTLAWTGGVGFDIVLDLVGGAYTPASLAVLAPLGRLMLLATLAGASATLDLRRLLTQRLATGKNRGDAGLQ